MKRRLKKQSTSQDRLKAVNILAHLKQKLEDLNNNPMKYSLDAFSKDSFDKVNKFARANEVDDKLLSDISIGVDSVIVEIEKVKKNLDSAINDFMLFNKDIQTKS